MRLNLILKPERSAGSASGVTAAAEEQNRACWANIREGTSVTAEASQVVCMCERKVGSFWFLTFDLLISINH